MSAITDFLRKKCCHFSFDEAADQYKAWSNSGIHLVYKHKRVIKQYQKTYLGYNTLSIATPYFDENKNIRYVVMVSRDNYEEIQVPSGRELENFQPSYCLLEQGEENFEGPQMHKVQDLALKMSKVTVPCLLLGKSGTGKTFLAKYIHMQSARAAKPFYRWPGISANLKMS